jgi:hypothetical protein
VDLSVIHDEVPRSLASDVFVAEVQFEPADVGWSELLKGIRASVVRVIQGQYRNNLLIVRDVLGPDEIRITCYSPMRNGGRGIIVGKPSGVENGSLVLKPIFWSPPQFR